MRLKYLFDETKINGKKDELLIIEDIKPSIKKLEGSNFHIVEYITSDNNEKSAKKISKINYRIENDFEPIAVLINDSSEYFNKRIYPLINEFERKLRELLYLVKALSNIVEAKNNIANLESKDFGELFTMLFVDNKFNSRFRDRIKEIKGVITKKSLLDNLNSIEENTLFDKLFKEEDLPDFKKNFEQVRYFRNDIMHARNINYEDYIDSKNLFKQINSQIESQIKSIIEQKLEKTNIKYEKFNNSLEKIVAEEKYLKSIQGFFSTNIDTQRAFEQSLKAAGYRQLTFSDDLMPAMKAKMALVESLKSEIEAQMASEEAMKPTRDVQRAFEEAIKHIRDVQRAFEEAIKPIRDDKQLLMEL